MVWARQASSLANGVEPVQGAPVNHDNILILKKEGARETISNRSSSPLCSLVMVRQTNTLCKQHFDGLLAFLVGIELKNNFVPSFD